MSKGTAGARWRGLTIAMVVSLLLPASMLSAQTSLATIRGSVTDQQGGILPGVTITARQAETNTVRTGVTNSSGLYYLPNLPPGTWQVTFELPGFTTARQNIVLRVGQEVTSDLVMKLGNVEEAVTVTGTAAPIEIQNALGQMIDKKDIDALPTVSRDFASLAKLAPGITSSGTGAMGFSTAGQRQYQNQIFVDGATNAQQFYGTQAESFPQDWVQEFQVMTNGFSAEYGQASGAVLNVITRSGTNDFRGRAYGFFQDSKLNSPPYSGHFVNGRPQLLSSVPSYNQRRFGGFLGGPIVPDKGFFFVGVEDYVNNQQVALSISPYWIGQGVQTLIPAKNTNRVYMVKSDWNLGKTNRLSLRQSRTFKVDENCSGQGGDGCNSQPTWTLEKRATFHGPLWSALGNLTSSFSASAFNELRGYYGVNKLYIDSNIAGKSGQALLDDTANLGQYSEKTYPGASFGSATTGGLEGESNLYFIDNFMWVKGNHQFKMGGELARVMFFMDIDASQKGRWGFPTDLAFDVNTPASYPTTFSAAVGTAKYFHPSWDYGLFVQDTWSVNDNLTLNLGLRWDVDNTILTGNELVDAYNQRLVSRFGGSPVLTKVKPDHNNVAPRLGFIWVPTGDRKTTIRGSAGIFYDRNHFNYNDVYINQTLLAIERVSFDANSPTANPFYNPADPAGSAAQLRAYLAQSFPNFPDLSQAAVAKQFINGMAPDFRIPYQIQATAGFTHDFPRNLELQADYIYSRSDDVVLSNNINIAFQNGQYVTIDPRFTNISLFSNLGWIRYHALQAGLRYNGDRLRSGISYTLAKATSNSSASGVGGGTTTNPLDLSIDDGPTNEDRRHNLVIDGSYIFPAQFQLSGIWHYSSPLPWTVTSQFIVFARPEPRNSRRGDNDMDMDLRFSKGFNFGDRSVTVFWEAFNLFNTQNFTRYQGSLQASNFGLPQSAGPMRQQQFGFRFDF